MDVPLKQSYLQTYIILVYSFLHGFGHSVEFKTLTFILFVVK